MTSQTIDQQVSDAAASIESAANDSTSTSTRMLDEVNKTIVEKGLAGNDGAMKALTLKLEQDHVLPKLLLAEFDNDSALKQFGDGNKFDIDKLKETAGKGTPAERLLAQAFLDNLQKIATAGNGDNTITRDDLEAWSNQAAKPTLNDETLNQTADKLHEAINRLGFLHSNDPDKDTIMRLLEPLNEADRAALEKKYHQKYDPNGSDDTLRKQLKDKLGDDNSVDWRSAEAVLNRHDGRTNDAGAVMVALTMMRDDKTKGNAMLRSVLQTLNEKTLADLDRDFKEKYGKSYLDAINGNKNLAPETKEALPILVKGVDHRNADDLVALSQIAVKYRNLQMFGESINGDSPEARQARKLLQDDQQFRDKFASAFPSDAYLQNPSLPLSFEERVNRVALDYLQEGRVSLATVAAANTNKFIFDNKDNITLAAKSASRKEIDDFTKGEQLALNNTDPKSLTAEQAEQLAYYKKIHAAFKSGGNDREVAIWEDNLEHGKDTIISQMARTHDDGKIFGWFANTNEDKLFSAVENLSRDDWERLKGINPADPKAAEQFRKEIEISLDSYAKNEKERILDLLNKKVAFDKYEDTLSVRRTLVQTIEDNRGTVALGLGTDFNGDRIVDQIVHLSPDEASRYQKDESYRKSIDQFVNEHLTDVQKLLAQRLLAQLGQSGKSIDKLAPVDQVLFDTMNGAGLVDRLQQIQTAFDQDKTLSTRLDHPPTELSSEDSMIKMVFENTLSEAYYKNRPHPSDSSIKDPLLSQYSDELFKNGHLPVGLKLELDFPKSKALYEEVAAAPEAERTAALAKLTADEREMVEAAMSQNGKLRLEDQIRSFVLGEKIDPQTFKSPLLGLDDAGKENLKNEYHRKYGSVLDDDFLSKIDEQSRASYKSLITPAHTDGRQDYYDQVAQQLKNAGGILPDGSEMTVDRATALYAEALEKYQKQGLELPIEEREKLADNFSEALRQYKDSKEKLAEVITDASITVLAVGATIASGGTLGPAALSLVVGMSAGLRTGAEFAIRGGSLDFNAENFLRQAIIGGTTGLLNTLGPEAFLALGKIGETAALQAGEIIAKSETKALLKEGGDKIIQSALKQAYSESALYGRDITKETIDQIAAQALKQGGTAAEKEALARAIADTFNGQLKEVAQKNLLESLTYSAQVLGREGALNALIAGGANAASEPIISFASGQGFDLKQLETAGWTGLATGFVAPIAFRGVFKGIEYGGAGISHVANNGAETEIAVNVARSADGGVLVTAERNPQLAGIRRADGTEIMIEPGKEYRFQDGDQPIPRTDSSGQVIMGRPQEEVEAKFANLKKDLGINPWDLPSVQRRKLLNDLQDNYRIRVTGNGDHINIYDGNTRYALAKKLGISDDDIPVVWKDTEVITLGELKRRQVMEAPKPLPVPIKGEDGRYYIHDGSNLVPLELGSVRSGQPVVPSVPGESVRINGQSIPPGKIVEIGSGIEADIKIGKRSEGISGKQACVFVDDKGNTYIADPGSKNGTFIKHANGQTDEIPKSDPETNNWKFTLLQPGDKIVLGKDGVVTDANGEITGNIRSYELNIKGVGEVATAKTPPSKAAVDQSNLFADADEESKRLEDGWQNSGHNRHVDANGEISNPAGVATVVDRQADQVLAATIKTAKERFGQIQPPEERALQLTKYVQDLLGGKGTLSDSELDNWYANFSAAHNGQRVMLGEFIEQGKGACSQQAILLKVLADDLFQDVPNAKVTLVRGNGTDGGTILDHDWVTIDLGNGEKVYDPRASVEGKPLSELPNYKSGQEIKLQQIGNSLLPGDVVTYDGSPWKIKSIDAQGNVTLRQDANYTVPSKMLTEFGENKDNWAAGIKPGQKYKVRQPDGTVDDWIVDSYNPTTKNVTLTKPDFYERTVTRRDIAAKGSIDTTLGGDYSVRTDYKPDDYFPDKRIVKIAGKEYALENRNTWFYPSGSVIDTENVASVKLHVTAALNPSEMKGLSPEQINELTSKRLRQLQELLIPELEKPEYKDLLETWKTLNPTFPESPRNGYGQTGQTAKAFTLYVKTPEAADLLEAKIDELLASHAELRLDEPPKTGNVDTFGPSKSNRVSRVRDNYPVAHVSSEVPDRLNKFAQLDPALNEKVLQDPSLSKFQTRRADGKTVLNAEGLQMLEKELKLEPGYLTYDDSGSLAVRLSFGDVGSKGTIYATETGRHLTMQQIDRIRELNLNDAQIKQIIEKGYIPGTDLADPNNYFSQVLNGEEGHLTDRAAIYALYKKYGLNPADYAK